MTADQRTDPIALIRHAVRPRRLMVMLRKLVTRLFGSNVSAGLGRRWAREHAADLHAALAEVDAALWDEAIRVSATLKQESASILAKSVVNLGGGGCYPLLYFCVRRLRPAIVVETGVAAGFSSCAMLMALEENGAGRLFSSDFPYFRLRDAERYIGILVPERLRANWTLMTEGDRANLPEILKQINQPIDLIHYDSDKSHAGRTWACGELLARSGPATVWIMDDIQDDLFFAEWTKGRADVRVFEFEGKYLGVVGFSNLIRSEIQRV